MTLVRLLLVLSFCSTPAMAADLSKIDRTLAKEPKYQSKAKYCLLVFGPQAKTRVWLSWTVMSCTSTGTAMAT
jgi:hypothetical protein